MAPSFAHLPPYAKAAFIAAQLDALAGPDEPIEDPFEAPTEALIEQHAQAPLPNPPAAAPAPAPEKRPKKRKLAASNRAKIILRAAKIPKSRTATDDSESSFEHHRRKCQVCNHPDREAIEELFIAWHSPRSIRIEFGTYHRLDCSSIYRHARAAGLYAKRRKNLRAVFDLILEHAGNIEPTAHGIVAIVRAYSCLTDTHDWIEPERRVHVVNHVYRHDVPVPASTVPASADSQFVSSASAAPPALAVPGGPSFAPSAKGGISPSSACTDEGRAVAGVPASADSQFVSSASFGSTVAAPPACTNGVDQHSSFRAPHPREVVASVSGPTSAVPACPDEGRAVAVVPASPENVVKVSSSCANYPRDVVTSSAPEGSGAPSFAQGLWQVTQNEKVANGGMPSAPPTPACPDKVNVKMVEKSSSSRALHPRDAVAPQSALAPTAPKLDVEMVEKGASFRALHPRDVVASQSAPEVSAAPFFAQGLRQAAQREEVAKGGISPAPSSPEDSAAPARPDKIDVEMVEDGSSFRASYLRDVVSSQSLPASPASHSSAPVLATSHSPLATGISNRHTPEIRIASNSHKTNDRNISNRHI